jgi:V8-like Glu-specific endopeptidase
VTRALPALLLLAGCVTELDAPTVPLQDPGRAVFAYIEGHSRCTAVAVDAHAALTAAHCVRGRAARLQQGEALYRISAAELDQDADLATLTLQDILPGWLRYASSDIHPGDVVQVWGYGCGSDSVTDPVQVRAGVALTDHSARTATCPGDSGGAVLGKDGLAGIVWGVGTERTEFTPL